MHRLQELVRLYRLGTGVRERARLLTMSTRTERAYRTALAEAGLLEGAPDAVPELIVLRAAVELAKPLPPAQAVPSSVDPWLEEIHRKAKAGAGPQAIWDSLHRSKPKEFTASVSAVKRAVRRWRREQPVQPTDVAIPVVTGPGEVAQVDFGFAGWFFDPDSGKVRRAWVFVMVLAFSRHMFAKLVFDQKVSTWIQLHVEAFDWFGGVPETVVPDNLKAAVVRAAFGVADRHQLALNRSYRELAKYYGFKIDPTPVASPEKKGKVESGVKYVRRNFLAAGLFQTLVEANAEVPGWLTETAGQRIHGSTGWRPLEAFATEQGDLRPLPATPYDPVIWKQATVHADSHVEFERRLYSVPWMYLGQRVWVKATRHSVVICLNDERIATHERRGAKRHSTTPGHLPEHRADLAIRSLTYWTERADRLGDEVGTYIRNVIASDEALSKLRDVQAIVTHLETFPQLRAVAAARRADYYAIHTYSGIRRILADALDLEPLPRDGARHGQLTAPRFARSVSELLLPTLERTA